MVRRASEPQAQRDPLHCLATLHFIQDIDKTPEAFCLAHDAFAPLMHRARRTSVRPGKARARNARSARAPCCPPVYFVGAPPARKCDIK